MNYAELSVAQNQRAKEFSKAQTDAMVAYCNAEHDLRELQAENDKLRELVLDMWQFTGAACKRYPRLFDPVCAGGQMVRPNMLDNFEQRLAELGVEVES